jgi:hypothetical protein
MHKAGLASLAFFYFDFRDNNRNDLRSLLSSLLFQLYHQSAFYSNILSGLYAAHRHGSRYPSNAALKQCLKDMLNCPGQVPIYIIIDGVDECPKFSGKLYARNRVLELVKELVDLHLPNIHISIASRPEIDIKNTIHPLASHSVSLHDEEGQMQDIVNYVTFIVGSDPGIRRRRVQDKDLFVESLLQKADGM